MRPWLRIVSLIPILLAFVATPVAAGDARLERADQLFSTARRRFAEGTHEQRQFAFGELEEAARLAPERPEIALTLARLDLEAGFVARARHVALHVVRRDSTCSDAWRLLGEAEARGWLLDPDPDTRDRAIGDYMRAASLAQQDSRTYARMVPLLLDAGEPVLARQAAELGSQFARGDPVADVMRAEVEQEQGELVAADRDFREAIPRLPREWREHYDDLRTLLPPRAVEAWTAMRESRAAWAERFWASADPDPVTSINEARVEFWARVTQALALYGPGRAGVWDMRAQYLVRFGRPDHAELNPVSPVTRDWKQDFVHWSYRDFGIRLPMAISAALPNFDRPLGQPSVWATASRDSLREHPEYAGLASGWAVFHRLPPGTDRLETKLALARFPADGDARVLAQVEVPGRWESRWTAQWAVRDSDGTVVDRQSQRLAASACRPGEARAAGFTTRLHPGRYQVGVHVSDGMNRIGLATRDLVIPLDTSGVVLSDVVITCSPPEQSVGEGPSIRLEPETGLFEERGDRLDAYFEISSLSRDDGGVARFAYACALRPRIEDARGWVSRWLAPRTNATVVQVHREEEFAGPVRRQFLVIPIAEVPAGHWQLEVRVKDRVTGEEAISTVPFDRGR